ncbi:MAG TPA: PKD domain-containing protein [Gemmataceae bacterium]|nr:PKD domain-containing protein [Gemmataceae bacterium]
MFRSSFFPKHNRPITGKLPRYQPGFETLEERSLLSVAPAHIYDLNSGLADQMGGPALIADGGTLTGGRYVFGMDQGLRLDGALADTTNYSVVLVAQLDFTGAFFKKVIDFQERTIDQGLYVSGSTLQLYPGPGGSGTITSNQDFQVALTRDGSSGVTSVYLNGVLDQTYVGVPSNVAIPSTNVLTFFEDDFPSHALEAVPGSVASITIYNQPLTATDISDLAHPPGVTANQSAVTVNEGQTATNMGTWTGNVLLSASAGTVTQNADGTWNWSLATTDGPEQSQTVTITAIDQSGATATTSYALTVNPVSPAVSISGPATATEGAAYTLDLSYSHPGEDTVQAWTINWGDGTTVNLPGNPTSATHTYVDGPNHYTISASAVDDDGTHAAGNTVAVAVANLPPVLTVNNATVAVNEGQTASNSGTVADVGQDPVTLTASVGTVTQNSDGTWSWSLATTDGLKQSQTVTITATDDDGATATASFALTVNQSAPVITSLVVTRSPERQHSRHGQVDLRGTFTDADAAGPHTVTVSWGDGTAVQTLSRVDEETGQLAACHHYRHDGVFTITVTVSNAAGGQATRTTRVDVCRGGRVEPLFDFIAAEVGVILSEDMRTIGRHARHRTWTCTMPSGSLFTGATAGGHHRMFSVFSPGHLAAQGYFFGSTADGILAAFQPFLGLAQSWE